MESGLNIEDVYKRQVIRSPILALGPKLNEFEQAIADYVGVKHAIAVNSGTSGLHLLIRAFGIRDGDEVITTPFSFIASSNCIVYERAKPVFVDIEPDTANIDPRPVSYTHLDVYKRQSSFYPAWRTSSYDSKRLSNSSSVSPSRMT